MLIYDLISVFIYCCCFLAKRVLLKHVSCNSYPISDKINYFVSPCPNLTLNRCSQETEERQKTDPGGKEHNLMTSLLLKPAINCRLKEVTDATRFVALHINTAYIRERPYGRLGATAVY